MRVNFNPKKINKNSSYKDHIYSKLKYKQCNLTNEEQIVVDKLKERIREKQLELREKDKSKKDKNKKDTNYSKKAIELIEHNVRSNYSAYKNLILYYKRYKCQFSLCGESFETELELNNHLSLHLNRKITISTFYSNLIKQNSNYTSEQFYSSLENISNEFLNSEFTFDTLKDDLNSRKTKRLIYVISFNDDQLDNKSNTNNLNLNNNPKEQFFNNLNYIGISELEIDRYNCCGNVKTSISKDNRLFYKQLFTYLAIKLELTDNLSVQEQMLINHLKNNQSISVYGLYFDLTSLDLYLLEKSLISIGFPNLINSTTGDLNWNFLSNIDNDLQIVRQYFINLLLKSSFTSFNYTQLDKQYSGHYEFAKFCKIKSIGTCSSGLNNASKSTELRTFLETKFASTIDGMTDLMDTKDLDKNYVKRGNEDGDDKRKIECCCGCGLQFAVQSNDYYQHLIEVNNIKILDYTNTKLRCFICNDSSGTYIDYTKKPPFSLQTNLYNHFRNIHLK